MNDSNRHHSYLLRLWLEQGEENDEWRASIKNVQNGQEHGFGCLDDLYSYLQYKTARKELDEADDCSS